ncbi:unnamed protein product [Urochloa decumbens]
MSAIMRGSAMMETPDVQVMEWMRQVREVTYDAEDCVDLFMHQAARKQSRSSSSILTALVRQKSQEPILPRRSSGSGSATSPRSPTRSLVVLARSSSRLSFAEQMRQLVARVAEANDRHKRYKVPGEPASDDTADDLGSCSVVTIDPQLILMQHTDPVAMEGPTQELHEHLAKEEKHATVTSIVGMAGIGKTTLATQVYLTTQERFDCRALVYVGRRPSVRRVLLNIISQLRRNYKQEDITNEHQAMITLRDLLHDKRYLIIIDDIWSISAWKAISCALPQNDHGSRIVMTTRNHDVARSCSSHPSDYIYEMKTLGDSDSKKLFHRRVFGSEEVCSHECRALHDGILKICGGLPLTIVVVASFLGRTAKLEEWEMIYNSTLSVLEKYPLLQGMKKILQISYANLPFPIKSCFLYLSTFPKNYKIDKDRLVWRWIAEGFIPEKGEESLWGTGISYFNELINRNLVQPVFTNDDDYDPVGCTVHGAIHDFVVLLSSEENFVTLDEELESMPRDVIRRLSLNYTKQEDVTLPLDTDISKARSLTVLGCTQRMPNLRNLELLRVLDLEGAEGLENRSLEDIGKLFNLKYLALGGERFTELPGAIGELQHLETLDMRQTMVHKLPSSVEKLQKLIRLLAHVLDHIPADWVEKMQGLQELSMVSVNSERSLKFVAELVKLKQLRILGVKWCFWDDGDGIADRRSHLVSSLNKISQSNISSLSIHSDAACSLGFLADSGEYSWDPPYQLQKLVLKEGSSSYFSTVPKNLGKCSYLTFLEIAINLGSEEDFLIIANLPALTILRLSARGKPIVIKQGFECLKVLWFQRCEDGLGLVFEPGAVPQLRKLCLNFKVRSQQQQLEEKQGRFVSGLEQLSSLKHVNVNIDCDGAMSTEVESVEKAIKRDIHVNSKKLKFESSRDNEEKMIHKMEGKVAAQEDSN